MAYERYDGAETEIQGESFTRTLTKKDGSIWEANEVASYTMIDATGTVVDTGDLTKSGDNLGLIFQVAKTVTTDFQGEYKFAVLLEDTIDLDFSDYIAYYTIVYTNLLGESTKYGIIFKKDYKNYVSFISIFKSVK